MSIQRHIQIYIAVLFVIAKNWKQLKYPSAGEWIFIQWNTSTMEYYHSAIKRNEPLVNAATCMNHRVIRMSEKWPD